MFRTTADSDTGFVLAIEMNAGSKTRGKKGVEGIIERLLSQYINHENA